jgi:aminoglycoside phosphotransferase (APT) family kinase protein
MVWLAWDEQALRDARAAGVLSSDLEEAVGWLDKYRDSRARTSSHPLHGDWGAVHVLARDGRVVALIDFGSARAGDSALDFARWDLVFDRPQHPTADILNSYTRVRDPGPELDVRRALCLLAHVKYLAPYFAKDGREAPLAFMKFGFGEELAWLRANA